MSRSRIWRANSRAGGRGLRPLARRSWMIARALSSTVLWPRARRAARSVVFPAPGPPVTTMRRMWASEDSVEDREVTKGSAQPRQQFNHTGHEERSSNQTSNPEHGFPRAAFQPLPERSIRFRQPVLQDKVPEQERDRREDENHVVDPEQRRPQVNWQPGA